VLERCGELRLPEPTKMLLLQMSRSTIDRCLGPARFKHPSRGLSTTKPGSLLRRPFRYAPSLPGMKTSLASWKLTWWLTVAALFKANISLL